MKVSDKLRTRCRQTKAVAEFNRDKGRPDGYNCWCRHYARVAYDARASSDPDYHRRRNIKHKYGLSLDEYKKLLDAACAICGAPAKHLDHSHASGKLRAALCLNCNTLLGQVDDNPALLRRAASYLEEHK